MATVGIVKELWRYPVKSMIGERVDAVQIGPAGLVGDRLWALRDEGRAEVQGAKLYPQLMQCSARFVAPPTPGAIPDVEVRFPDGAVVRSGSDAMNAALTTFIGRPASLWPLQPADNLAFYRRYKPSDEQFLADVMTIFAREDGEPLPDLAQFPPEILEYTSFPGMFFDVTPLQFVTTAALAHLRDLNPQARWDVRRFRPNLVIETVDGLVGMVEEDWTGKRLFIGDLPVDVAGPTPRCGMTTRATGDLPFDKSVLRTIVRETRQNLGAYAVTAATATVNVGDRVTLD
ncbi:MAG: MOSC domain-containing protein [Burkholderiales bacterium]|nr:MOSC domain-containing protein [Burkholderiales bacterium]